MKTIEKNAKRGEQRDVMKALTLLTEAYVDMCGISLGYRTVLYCAAEAWLERLAWLDLPLSKMARKDPFVHLMPHISKKYVAEEYDEYDIAPIDEVKLIEICSQMIREKALEKITLEVTSWGILKVTEEEKLLSQKIEVTAADGTLLRGMLEEQGHCGTMVHMIEPYDFCVSKFELICDPRELLVDGYNDYNKLLRMEDQIRALYPQYLNRLKECQTRWERHCAFDEVYGNLFDDMILYPYSLIKNLFGLDIRR